MNHSYAVPEFALGQAGRCQISHRASSNTELGTQRELESKRGSSRLLQIKHNHVLVTSN